MVVMVAMLVDYFNDELHSQWAWIAAKVDAIRFCARHIQQHTELLNYFTHSSRIQSQATISHSSVNPLQARTFGVWTFTSAVVRFYAAHNINNKVVYEIAIWTYAIVIAHYISELLYYRTSKLSAGIISPLVIGTILAASFVWMISQYDFYVKI
ncbi:hypothetical protein E3P92_01056 [Wallemia ichthyophaga]|uniref:Ergosterol biosynthetic protein 28 n=1 Tax=Wallemia ichthyophaga TaxID=245174 RepID=A0A4T0IWB6_WALIC|nr:hypothetical protein E3P97_01184 [Wallemia ichthyophaga]TIB02399.1 hypothetical protein E3P95_01007 [Wallemia ichthyophaga]TIB03172.1 hypothetical protein E3P94_01139 [Wallemia ichthyophaga]TIB15395.1 hypothetical protein E3P90_00928 [Wallemia ichthyophaga]TIB17213.1 hypothetical protein E3P93_00785 [Wallemia ichthyophaga]